MTVSLIIFLYIYFGFVAICSILGIMAIYHLNKFGQSALTTVLASLVFVTLIILVVYFTNFYLGDVNWREEIEILKYFFNSDYQL